MDTHATDNRHRSRKGRGGRPLLTFVVVVVVLLVLLGAGWLVGRAARPGVWNANVEIGANPAEGSLEATGSEAPAAAPPAVSKPATALAGKTALLEENLVRAAAVKYPGAPAIQPESISQVKTQKKYVAITLDDGIPFDTRLLDLFEERGVKCTTFALGQFAQKRPDLMARLNKDGFEIANHTYDHATLTKLSDAQVESELSRTQAAISKVTGNQAPYLRPPGGATNARVKSIAASMGYRVVLWDKSFADTSKYATPEKLYHNVMDDLKPGDIILCHWGGKGTYGAMRLILPEMKRRGFTPVPLSVLLKYREATGK